MDDFNVGWEFTVTTLRQPGWICLDRINFFSCHVTMMIKHEKRFNRSIWCSSIYHHVICYVNAYLIQVKSKCYITLFRLQCNFYYVILSWHDYFSTTKKVSMNYNKKFTPEIPNVSRSVFVLKTFEKCLVIGQNSSFGARKKSWKIKFEVNKDT